MSLQPEKLVRQVCSLAEEAGGFIQKQRGKITSSLVETKSMNSFVTFVDKESEKKLVKGLKKILPGSGFITEEETIKNERKEFTWVVDPLDGTTNFIHGFPCYCISIGLLKGKNELLLGVIYEPNQSEMFSAVKNGGAFLNGKQISVSPAARLRDSLLVTGFPTYDHSRMEEYIGLFRHLMENTHGLRRMGSAAVDLAYTACGRFDSFYEYSLSPWDVAAGALIMEEAGGKVSDFRGGGNFLFGKEIVASNGHTHAELIRTIKKFFK